MSAIAPRLFVAAEVPEAFRSLFASRCAELDRSVPGARWSRPDAIHLTFKFLGETDPSRIPAVAGALALLAERVSPLALRTGKPGLFGAERRPRVLWTGLEGDLAGVERLAAALDEAMESLGFPREERPYHPHLTLARFDPGRRIRIPDSVGRAAETLAAIPFPVHDMVLFESLLGPGGSRYIARERFALGGNGR